MPLKPINKLKISIAKLDDENELNNTQTWNTTWSMTIGIPFTGINIDEEYDEEDDEEDENSEDENNEEDYIIDESYEYSYEDLNYNDECSIVDAITQDKMSIRTIHSAEFLNQIWIRVDKVPIIVFNDIYQYLFEFRYYYGIYRILKGASKASIKALHMCCKYSLLSDDEDLNETDSDDIDLGEIDEKDEMEDFNTNFPWILQFTTKTCRNIDICKDVAKDLIKLIKKYKNNETCRETMKKIVSFFLETNLESVYNHKDSVRIIYECLVLYYRSFESHIAIKVNEILRKLYHEDYLITYARDLNNIDSTINKIIAALTLFRNQYIFRSLPTTKQKILFTDYEKIINFYDAVEIEVPSVIDMLNHFENDSFEFIYDEFDNMGIKFTETKHDIELTKVI